MTFNCQAASKSAELCCARAQIRGYVTYSNIDDLGKQFSPLFRYKEGWWENKIKNVFMVEW